MRQSFTFLLFLLLNCLESKSQDTFSIVALDSTTRQIGSAGASCLDLFWAGIADPSFLTDILPDTGAINTQSYFIQANQDFEDRVWGKIGKIFLEKEQQEYFKFSLFSRLKRWVNIGKTTHRKSTDN